MDVIAVAVVFLTITAIIVAPIAKGVVAFVGLLILHMLSKNYSLLSLAEYIDWDVLLVLLGTWIIINYMAKSNLPNYIAQRVLQRFKRADVAILVIAIVSGLISTFLANVQVVLLFAPIAMVLGELIGVDPLKASMIVALAANYMGTALMLGDLPPLLLHSVGGAEFFDFIVFRGRPGSFFVLLTSFILSIMLFYRLWFGRRASDVVTSGVGIESGKLDKFLAIASIVGLASLMTLAAFRPLVGLPLGVLAIVVGMVTALAVEIYKHCFNDDAPSFDEVLKDVEWETMALYALLFSLTGALERAGFFEDVAKSAAGLLLQSPVTAYTLLYWLTTVLCMFVEHDAFLLIMLYMVKDMALLYGLDPWPYYWGLAWSATLGSNATISAAPTLYLALVLAEKRSGRKRHWKEWLKITLPFTLVSSAINFAISIPVLFL